MSEQPKPEELNIIGQTDNAEPDAGTDAPSGTGWVEQLRFSKSFTAKLLLSDNNVKEYYSAIATELLSYERVRSHTGWTGVSFIAGRTQLARCVISGKTLCLYLAAEPGSISGAKYKALDVADTKKYEKTPALLKIRSRGGVKNAVQCIGEVAAGAGLVKKDPPPEPILPRLFPADSFHNLVTRGLIRFVRGKSTKADADADTDAAEVRDEVQSTSDIPCATDAALGIYTDTVNAARNVISRYAQYGEISGALASGDASIKMSEKKMLRALDEGWVRTIEDALPAINELMRRPSHFIAETEEILPMELTRKITGRSVVHLCQHTDYISSVEGDRVTPSKLLNVFREDSVLTYENKFLNTLLAHLYFFVTRRYRIALEAGVDERVDCVRFEDSFFHDDARGRICVSIELSEKLEDGNGVKKSFLGTPLWARVEKLNEIVKSYMDSDFVREMGRNYVNPPILRTNAILKNKYFRQCLELWNFHEGYDESGYGITVSETVRDPDDSYIRELYDSAATQYLLFRHHTRGEYADGNILSSFTSEEIHPHINICIKDAEDTLNAADFDTEQTVKSAKSGKSEYDNAEDFVYDPEERDILFAVRVALKAAEFYDAQNTSDTDDYSDELYIRGIRYEKTFEAKLRLASEEIKGYFVGLANALLSYDKIKMRQSRTDCAFYFGRTRIARITIKGKSLYFYTALSPEAMPPAYYVRNVSGIKRYSATPSLLRVRSSRWMKYAMQTVDMLAEKFALEASEKPTDVLDTEDFSMMTFDELLANGLIRRVSADRRAGIAETIGGLSPDELSPDEILPDEISPAGENVSESEAVPKAEQENGYETDIPEDIEVTYDSDIAESKSEKDTDSQTDNSEPGQSSTATDDSGFDENSDIENIDENIDDNIDDNVDEDIYEDYGEPTDDSTFGSQAELRIRKSGSANAAKDEHTAQYFENSSSDPENYVLPEKLPDAEKLSENERLLSDIRYPGAMDYSRPTDLGVDDSSGFIKDSEENMANDEKITVEPTPDTKKSQKRTFIGRIFTGFSKFGKKKEK